MRLKLQHSELKWLHVRVVCQVCVAILWACQEGRYRMRTSLLPVSGLNPQLLDTAGRPPHTHTQPHTTHILHSALIMYVCVCVCVWPSLGAMMSRMSSSLLLYFLVSLPRCQRRALNDPFGKLLRSKLSSACSHDSLEKLNSTRWPHLDVPLQF